VEEAEERVRILADALALKKSAVDWTHPEVGVTSVDATAFGRNYFNRYSAPETEEDEFADERAEILEEAAALKKSAAAWLHPEVGITESAPESFGRNYFNRYSADDVEDMNDAEEAARVLADAMALKKSAVDYMHPEVGVTTTDATACGRNYFTRYSAPDIEDMDDASEAARVLAEAASLKKLAVDYMHPEVGVTTTDATACGRNYFNRYSAPEVEDMEDSSECARILAEAASLKKLAVDFMHPESGVTATDASVFGRNYFNRYSAPETEDGELEEERARILADAVALEKSAVQYMHPEKPIEVDATAFGRNYFTRFSAPVNLPEQADESPEESQDVATVKSLAAAVKGANLPSTKSTKLSSSDSEFSATKKSASSVNLFGLTEEVV
jgi:hypothetical protein